MTLDRPSAALSKQLALVNSACAIVTRLLTVGVLGWVIQHFVRNISDEELAILPVVLSLTLLIPVLQSVLTSGLGRFVTEAYAMNDHARISRIAATMFPWQVGISLVLLLAGLVLAWQVGAVLPIPLHLVPQARLMILAIFFQFSLIIFLQVFMTGIYAVQKLYLISAIKTASATLRVILTLSLILGFGAKVQWVVVGQVFPNILATLAITAISLRFVPSLLPSRMKYDRTIASDILGFGGWYSVGQIASTIRAAADAPLLYRLATPLSVNTFFLGSYIESQIRALITTALQPLTPGLIALHALGHEDRFANAYVRGGRLALWASLLPATPIVVFRHQLFRFYLGTDAGRFADAETVTIVLLGSMALTLPAAMLMSVGTALAKIDRITKQLLFGQILNLGLTLLLVGPLKMGAVGAACATLISSLFYHPFLLWPTAFRLVNVKPRVFIIDTLVRGWSPAAIAGFAGWALREAFNPYSAKAVAVVCLFIIIVYSLAVVFFSCRADRADANRIWSKLRSR